MKIHALIAFAILLATGCASQSAYKPANGSGYGYKESRISDNRYRVTFKARGDDRDRAMDYALLRAAELTLLKGYDWFVVVNRESMVDRKETEMQSGFSSGDRVITRDCGLLGCTTRSYSTPPTYSAGVSAGGGSRAESVLEIRMGKGVRPSSGDSYDALSVRDSLQKKAG
ncbi:MULTISPECIES: hypothetical protein [unclassified Microbulbifer]|uniref:CC0125/CC1285 family lipoprotein n=1 Tax=unclassified Microbulbifer TaxID=2619833 RepID=UPI0027E452B1|nr:MULTISPECIES: hypothetical protein [unclassified Microbulbifer]